MPLSIRVTAHTLHPYNSTTVYTRDPGNTGHGKRRAQRQRARHVLEECLKEREREREVRKERRERNIYTEAVPK